MSRDTGRQSPGSTAQQSERSNTRQASPAASDERGNIATWWISFNGDLRLRRLSSVRQRLVDSPFTVEARFEEIGDGLIVLRLVTDKGMLLQQLEWIVGQLMEVENLDRHAAIVSRT